MSFQSFQGDIQAYVETHGTLEAALQPEPFPDFVERRRQTVPAPTRNIGAGGVMSTRAGAHASVVRHRKPITAARTLTGREVRLSRLCLKGLQRQATRATA